jgi:hypothetical protein
MLPMLLEPGWSEALRRHGFEAALRGWRRVHRDARAGVFVAVR